MTALNKQALIAKIKKQTKSFDTVVLKEDEANALLSELESQQTFQQAFFRQSLMYDVVAEAYEEAKEQIAKDVEIKAMLCLESNSLFDRLRAAEKRIAELVAKSAPESFSIIGTNILTQDNRITSDPMFCVYQKREIVVDADYDYDRIVWVDEDGNEANERQRMRLELLHENFREPPEKWRRVALKEIDDFVTCCFTEQGCKDYLACNGHNLRLPFIYVKSGFRNAEFISVPNWLAGIGVKGE